MEDSNKMIQKPFGLKDKLGYMFGDFGNDFTFIFASSFLMIFYTKVLGLSGALVGTLFLVSRVVDAFTDVGMGRLVDRLKPAKDGRFRPWIRRICVPVVVSSILMFLFIVKDWPYMAKVIYVFVTYILWGSICYTAINIPYGSMASVISTEALDRSSLSTFRSIGGTFAGLTISMLSPLFIYTTDAAGNQIVIARNFTLLAIIYGGFAILCYILCYKFCTERIQLEYKTQIEKEKTNLFQTLFSNKALLAIIGAALLLLLAMLLSQAMSAYLFMDYFKNTKILSLVGLISTGATLIVAPFAARLAKRYGKKEIGSFSVLVSSLAYFLLYFLHTKNIGVYLAIMFIGTLGMGLFNVIIWAFITDVIDYQEIKTNKREDGTVYAVYSFSRKLGQALAGGVGGYALTIIGYASSATSQTQAVTDNIYTVSTLVPAICYLLVAMILFFIYPLSKTIVEENTEILKKRHG